MTAGEMFQAKLNTCFLHSECMNESKNEKEKKQLSSLLSQIRPLSTKCLCTVMALTSQPTHYDT